MTAELRELLHQKVTELMAASSCCPEALTAGEAWLAACGTAQEQEATRALVAELEQDIMPVEGCIAFMGSDIAKEMLGAEFAQKMHAHALELKAAGAKFCDCPACTAAAGILAHKAELLA